MGIFTKQQEQPSVVEERDEHGNTITKKARFALGKKGM
jgi:hypothetical protein